VHVPPNDGKTKMPVMFVISPSIETPSKDSQGRNFDAKNFEPETGMNQYADQDKFVTVYALPENHKLGAGSLKDAEAWNAPGAGIDNDDVKLNGYNDEDYIKSIANMMPQLANVDSSHKDWGAIAFSQGGMFLNQLSHDEPNLFPSVGLVGTTMETNHDYSTAQGNAKNVLIENLDGDQSTLPMPGSGSLGYDLKSALVNSLNFQDPRTWFEGKSNPPDGDGLTLAKMVDPLGAIDNRDQDPRLQESLYMHDLSELGPYTQQSVNVPTPGDQSAKNTETKYTSNGSDGSLEIVDLPDAQHSYPGPDHGIRVNATPQYLYFNTSQEFANLFEQYNQTVDH
jgi:hypothetical protein